MIAELAVGNNLHNATDQARLALAIDRRHINLASQVYGDLGAHAGRDHLPHGAGIMDGEGGDVDTVIEKKGLTQITDSDAITEAVSKVIQAFPEKAEQVRSGEGKIIGFLVGQVMKATSGKANPQAVNEELRKQLLG